jgi:peptide/nickel transport system permease protein
MRRLRRFFARWQNWLGLGLVLFYVGVALTAPWLAPQDPKNPGPYKKVGRTRLELLKIEPHPPSDLALLGTMPGQYDVFYTLVWGTRDALQFGLVVAFSAGLFGVVFGTLAGYAGGLVNGALMRISDAFLAFPPIAGLVFLQQLMAVAIEAAGGIYLFNSQYMGPLVMTVGPPTPIQVLLGLINPLMLSLILFTWMPYARMVNALVIGLKNMDFIQASRALGAGPLRMIFRHLLPNALSPAIVMIARDVGSVVILQATLTFIRLGGGSLWGDMLATGRNWVIGPGGSIFRFWWVFVPATLALVLFGIGWNLLGDGLNDFLDPRQ